MPFNNQIVGGGGVLVRPAIKSKNFVHGTSGWSINADGSAEFQNVVLPSGSGGGTTLTIGPTKPTSPNAGDVWWQIAGGVLAAIQQYDAAAADWVPYQAGAGAVAPGTVLDGAVDGTTIAGATLESDGTGLQIVVYDGTPGPNKLAFTVAGTAGTDAHGNNYPAGSTWYGTGSSGAGWAFCIDQGGVMNGLVNANGTNSQQGTWTNGVRMWQEADGLHLGGSSIQFVDGGPAIWGDTPDGSITVNTPVTAMVPGSAGDTETWHTIKLNAGWSLVSGHPAPAYRLLPDGTVQLKGYASYASTFTGYVSLNSTAGLLDAAYRPSGTLYFPGDVNRSAVEVLATGEIRAYGATSAGNNQIEPNIIYGLG